MINSDEIFGEPKVKNFQELPDFYWILHLDKFLHKHTGDIYSDDEIMQMKGIREKWQENVPEDSLREALEIFPEAVKIARKYLKIKVKENKERLKLIDDWRENCNETLNKFHKPDERELWKKHFDEGHAETRGEVERKIKKLQFSLSYLDELEGKKEIGPKNGVTEADIARAKEVPITNFIQVKAGFATCPFHTDKTPSLKVYKTNDWYCYSCNSGGTVIDFIMKQLNKTFLEAVKFLLQ